MATHQDAMLIIEFSRWAQEWGFHPANAWVRSHRDEVRDYEEFIGRYAVGTPEYRHPFTVLGYFENLGLFHRHSVIDEAMLFDWLDFTEPWTMMGPFALSQRAKAVNPTLWTNFEGLASAQGRYLSVR